MLTPETQRFYWLEKRAYPENRPAYPQLTLCLPHAYPMLTLETIVLTPLVSVISCAHATIYLAKAYTCTGVRISSGRPCLL